MVVVMRVILMILGNDTYDVDEHMKMSVYDFNITIITIIIIIIINTIAIMHHYHVSSPYVPYLLCEYAMHRSLHCE
jgi:hypothetical protein